MMSDFNGSLNSDGHNKSVLVNSVIKESENLNLVSYLEISRFVSDDSVTRGMLNVVETEAIVESCNKKSLSLDYQNTQEIAGLRRELELISKLLSDNTSGDDIDEPLESKSNVFGSIGSTAAPVWAENGLIHLSRVELINYFKNEMIEMKREHERRTQEMTDEYFSIKRRSLSLEKRGFISCLKKYKEFDVMRNKIPDIISKLDKVFWEDEKSVFDGRNYESLLLQNRQLKDRLIDLEDSCVESYVKEECCAVIYKESLKEVYKKLEESNMSVWENERALRSEMVEKKRLKEKIYCLVKEKENLVHKAEDDLAVGKEKLELAKKNMEIAGNEKVKLEMILLSTKAEQERTKNQFVSTVLSVFKWSQGFDNLECVLKEKIKLTNARLESMQSQLSGLFNEVDELKARESMYKKQMEKNTCDLHKAETEVDLLGDEIESLLDLLAKIYIALDHYSIIFKHYPGILEILKLVRRKLKENQRLSVFRPKSLMI